MVGQKSQIKEPLVTPVKLLSAIASYIHAVIFIFLHIQAQFQQAMTSKKDVGESCFNGTFAVEMMWTSAIVPSVTEHMLKSEASSSISSFVAAYRRCRPGHPCPGMER